MNQTVTQNDPLAYAKNFTGSISGTRILFYREIPDIVKQYVKGTLTLDYGCGPAQSTLFLKSLGLNVAGVDINEHMISAAKLKDPSGQYSLIVSGKIPSEDNHYDLVATIGVLVHASSREELRSIIKECSRVLKVGGIFLAIVNSDVMYQYEWVSADTNFKENENLTSGSLAKYFSKETNSLFDVFYWSEKDYLEVIIEAGLTLQSIVQPLAKDIDVEYNWINEKTKPFSSILIAKKLSE